MQAPRRIAFNVNGQQRTVEVTANATLLETLRELGLYDVKSGCEKGDCGACAVLVDGIAIDSCLTLTWTVEGRTLTTVAGMDQADPRGTVCSA